METLCEVATPFGPVHMWGRDTGRPVLFAIAGAFAAPTYLHLLQTRFPELDLWRTHLPGNHCPPLVTASVGVFGAAYSQALSSRLGGRPALVVGASVGALVAMALGSPEIRASVLVEPPLRTGQAWPLRTYPAKAPPGSEDFLWNVLGVSAERQEPRDYLALVDQIARPAIALVGGEPLLPERRAAVMPSLVDEESRARLRAHPLVEVVECAGAGHNIPRLAPRPMLDAIRRLAPRVVAAPAAPQPLSCGIEGG